MKPITKRMALVMLMVLLVVTAVVFASCGEDPVAPTPPAETNVTVTFDAAGGTETAPQTISSGGLVSEPAAPTRDGYTFAYWTLNGVVYDFSVPVTGNLTLVAKWNKIGPYTVTFKDADGTELKTETVENTAAATAPADPTRPGYEFTGWDKAFDRITSDTTVTAQYIRVWTVTFNDHDGTLIENVLVRDGQAAVAPANPTREGYTFTGWSHAYAAVTSDMTITAEYRQNDPEPPAQYTVTFNDYNGTLITTANVTAGGTVVPPSDPTREGYTFRAWLLDGDDFALTTPITASITLVADYTEDTPEPPAQYTVTFNDYNGTLITTANVTAGGTVVPPSDLTREGYTFRAWLLDGDDFALTTPITASITLVADYTEDTPPAPSTYTVSFETHGYGVIPDQTIPANGTATKPADPEREGYLFTGWTLNGEAFDFSTPITASISLEATYKQEIYHVVTFNHANGTGATTPVTVLDGTGVAAQPAPAYHGFTFLYWAGPTGEQYQHTTAVVKDITLTAVYERDASVTIPNSTASDIVIDPGYLAIWEGLELEMNINALVYNESGTYKGYTFCDLHYEGMTYTFYSVDPTIASVTAAGVVTPVSLGSTQIYVVIHKGGTMVHDASVDYKPFENFTVLDGAVIKAINVNVVEKPAYLTLAETDENQQFVLPSTQTNRIDINDHLSMPEGDYGSANISLWYNGAEAVFTMTADDNPVVDFEQWIAWQKQYGIPVSIMAPTPTHMNDASVWRYMNSLGNTVSPHGQYHYSAQFYTSEFITSAQTWMECYLSKVYMEKATGEEVLIFAYPCGHIVRPLAVQLFIGGRGVNGFTNHTATVDYMNVCINDLPTAETITGLFDETATGSPYSRGGWVNILYHTINNDAPKIAASYDAMFPYVSSGQLWAATFDAAVQYGQERDTASILNMSAGTDVITFSLTDKMNDTYYDHALTVRIKADATWGAARAYQNGNEIDARVVTENGETYLLINAVPDRGEVKVVRTSLDNLNQTENRITFTPTDITGTVDEASMTVRFTVDAAVWTAAYATQNGAQLPTDIKTQGGVTTVTTTCTVGGGEVTIVPVTNQYADRGIISITDVITYDIIPNGTMVITISTAEEMELFSAYVNAGNNCKGLTIRLENDIDMQSVENFTPIGWQYQVYLTLERAFSGTFDGNGKTIRNLNIKYEMFNVGLFGMVNGGTIKNLSVMGRVEGGGVVGGIVGQMGFGEINGCSFEGTVINHGSDTHANSGSVTGGIAGRFYASTMRNCSANATVVSYAANCVSYQSASYKEDIQSGLYTGGIIGEIYYHNDLTKEKNWTNIDHVSFEGTVTAHRASDGTGATRVGGFVGYGQYFNIKNCSVNATVVGGNEVGGFIGYSGAANWQGSIITNCSVTGRVCGDDYVGGFLGKPNTGDASQTVKFTYCYTDAYVTGKASTVNIGAVVGGEGAKGLQKMYYNADKNPGLAAHPGTVNADNFLAKNHADSITALNTNAAKNSLNTWHEEDGTILPTNFPLYLVTILDKDGNEIEKQLVSGGGNVILPTPEKYLGFEFTEWSGVTTGVTEPGTIRAIYREVSVYTVTFYDKDGGVLSTQEINAGNPAEAPEAPDPDGLYFTGWDTAFGNITATTEVRPVYVTAYIVTFSYKGADGNDTTSTEKVPTGGGATAPAVPVLLDWSFVVWDKAFDNVTGDITVTAQYNEIPKTPSTLNILQWTLTSKPGTTYFETFGTSDIIMYTGSNDLSAITLPAGWEAQYADGKMNNYAKPEWSAIIYNTEKYRFDETAGKYHTVAVGKTLDSSVLAVPLIELSTGKQFVIVIFAHGANGSTGSAQNYLNEFLPAITTQYPGAQSYIVGWRASSGTSTNTGYHTNGGLSAKDNTPIVEGYDLVSYYELASAKPSDMAKDNSCDYILAYVREGTEVTLDATETIDATTGISNYNGIRYSMTVSRVENEE